MAISLIFTLALTVLNGSNLAGIDLHGATLIEAEFNDVDLTGADLSFALLFGADFSNAIFDNACLDFSEFIEDGMSAKGLTQDQINNARIETGREPALDGVLDAATGRHLIWKADSDS